MKSIVMTTENLKELLAAARRYRYYWVYDSEQNRDGQGEWHCDVWLDDENELGEDGWGDGEECFSFDEAPKVKKIPVKKVEEYELGNDLPSVNTLGDLVRYTQERKLKGELTYKVVMKNNKLCLILTES